LATDRRERLPSVLMLEGGGGESRVELLLQPSDFPKNFVDMAHPEDFIPTNTPIDPDLFDHEGHYGHHRLILRVSFLTKHDDYIPLTFVVDTGAPFHFYLSAKGTEALEKGGRLLTDGAGQEYMKIFDQNVIVHETPTTHRPANILGLKMIKILKGLQINEGGFSFHTPFIHF